MDTHRAQISLQRLQHLAIARLLLTGAASGHGVPARLHCRSRSTRLLPPHELVCPSCLAVWAGPDLRALLRPSPRLDLATPFHAGRQLRRRALRMGGHEQSHARRPAYRFRTARAMVGRGGCTALGASRSHVGRGHGESRRAARPQGHRSTGTTRRAAKAPRQSQLVHAVPE